MQQVYCEPGQNRKIAALSMRLCARFFMVKNMVEKKIIDEIKKMNRRAIKNGDIPVSCVITKNGKIISKAYNIKHKNKNPFDHAEIIAIKKACKKLNTVNLIDCELYVSLFPCLMCQGAITEARIKKVFYILDKNKNINNTTQYERTFVQEKSYFNQEIKQFFEDKR